MGSRVLMVVAAAVVVLAGIGVLWVTVLHDDLVTYRHAQQTYADQAPPARVIELEGDEAAVSVGSPDGRVLTVQHRDPDGSGWTGPEEVFELDGRGRDFADTTAREEGGTVAVLALFSNGNEYDGDDLDVGLVCRDRECWVQREPGFGGEPEVAPDGATAYLGEDPRGAWLWDENDGIRRVAWSGHPAYGAGPVSASQPALAPDGSLRVAAARVVPGGCRFTLLVSAPLSGDLTPVATTTRPRGAPADSGCRPFLTAPGPDRVVVRPVDPGQRSFAWDRTGDGWSAGPLRR
ncbi:unannotated protein [freshwater metagenome]|uniref:Unannotated protein n=1 Tax=freshwater metagenome TaxID=449393 RepID=A0A6J6T1H9_9ZZZZ|nr:hypothetical protein [Actinomycetota bacterium]